MRNRPQQPAINPALRSREVHDFWPPFVGALAGLAVLVSGALHLTSVDTTDGDSATEAQLVKAFASSGLQYASRQPAPRPPNLEGVANPGEVLDRWAREQANRQPPTWKIRVDLGAKAACPT
jgi:hypothetical protein